MEITIPLSISFLCFLIHKLNCLRIRAATSAEREREIKKDFISFSLLELIVKPLHKYLLNKLTQSQSFIIFLSYHLIFTQTPYNSNNAYIGFFCILTFVGQLNSSVVSSEC